MPVGGLKPNCRSRSPKVPRAGAVIEASASLTPRSVTAASTGPIFALAVTPAVKATSLVPASIARRSSWIVSGPIEACSGMSRLSVAWPVQCNPVFDDHVSPPLTSTLLGSLPNSSVTKLSLSEGSKMTDRESNANVSPKSGDAAGPVRDSPSRLLPIWIRWDCSLPSSSRGAGGSMASAASRFKSVPAVPRCAPKDCGRTSNPTLPPLSRPPLSSSASGPARSTRAAACP